MTSNALQNASETYGHCCTSGAVFYARCYLLVLQKLSKTQSTHCVLSSTPKKVAIQKQRIIILNKHGEKLVGILHETGSQELVILCHGFRSSKDRIPMVNLAVAFGDAGVSAFRFDFAGNGESQGSFQYGNYRREADDLHAVVQHFRKKKRSIAAIVGHSKGGNVALLYASKDSDICTVVNISGRFDLMRGIVGRMGKDFLQILEKDGFIDVKNREGKIVYCVTKESLIDRMTTDMLAACKLIYKNCRVLTIHGTKDEMVPVEDAFKFAGNIANHKLHIIEGADHEFTAYQNDLASTVVDFVKTGNYQKSASKLLPSCSRANKVIPSRL